MLQRKKEKLCVLLEKQTDSIYESGICLPKGNGMGLHSFDEGKRMRRHHITDPLILKARN